MNSCLLPHWSLPIEGGGFGKLDYTSRYKDRALDEASRLYMASV